MLDVYILFHRHDASRLILPSTITTECLTQSPWDADAPNLDK